ncbi:DNA cytosine methyltransferase, partial [Streptococcus agalactiae]|nr:DNA cytosine methyltransferase [Streptococcus agalactiae]
MSHYNIIDIFSGAGGLTEGFRDSSFEIVKHIEKDVAASKTLLLRDIFYYLQQSNKLYLYNEYLNNKITFDNLLKQTPHKVLNKTLNIEIGDDTIDFIFNQIGVKSITGIIGGPPCQAYSTIGRAANRSKKDTDN